MQNDDPSEVVRQRHEKMLRLVAGSFYKELINYGVSDAEVLSVATHLLDNVVHKGRANQQEAGQPSPQFTLANIRDEWAGAKRLTVDEVSLCPLRREFVHQIAAWLQTPAIRQSFYPKFPESAEALAAYFAAPSREYFAVLYRQAAAGVIGAEHIDTESSTLEMRKLVGDPMMHGKGIGKRATLLFLYYAFVVRRFEKIYVHSLDTNIRNLNLNARFGFELEGVFLQDVTIQNQRQDVVRMAAHRSTWLNLFSGRQAPAPPGG
jgi:RimJ/RimL family protein N-acetyltransferase